AKLAIRRVLDELFDRTHRFQLGRVSQSTEEILSFGGKFHGCRCSPGRRPRIDDRNTATVWLGKRKASDESNTSATPVRSKTRLGELGPRTSHCPCGSHLCTASRRAQYEGCKALLRCCGSIIRRKKRQISTSQYSRTQRSNRSRITQAKNFPKRKAR